MSIGRFPFSRRNAPAGQSESGIATALDTTSAASGTSSVSGAPPLPPKATSTTTTSALPPLANERQRVLKTIEATALTSVPTVTIAPSYNAFVKSGAGQET